MQLLRVADSGGAVSVGDIAVAVESVDTVVSLPSLGLYAMKILSPKA